MHCPQCSRELRADSSYCDRCGCFVGVNMSNEKDRFDIKSLISGIAGSIIFSLLVMYIAILFKLPILFGGLFLPFFFRKKRPGG